MTDHEPCIVCGEEDALNAICDDCHQTACDSCWSWKSCCSDADAIPRPVNSDALVTVPMELG